MLYHNKIGPRNETVTKDNSTKEGDEDKKLSNERSVCIDRYRGVKRS